MALPKQSAFHRSTSASTLLLTAGLDCMDKLGRVTTHTPIFMHFLCHSKACTRRHNIINMHTNIFPSNMNIHIHIHLSYTLVDTHTEHTVIGTQGDDMQVCGAFSKASTVGPISH